jgi:hypothetical protein
MLTHPSNRLWAEVVRLGYHLHWSLDDILDLEHPVRRRVLDELAGLVSPPVREPSPSFSGFASRT